MFEIIIDVTNRCNMRCKYCGTDSSQEGTTYLPVEILESTIDYANENSFTIYLGGGCFFCHPDIKRLLRYVQSIDARNLIIDVPMNTNVLSMIQEYPMNEYHYKISVSLWGIMNVHNKLSNSNSWFLIEKYQQEMKNHQGYSAYSFVITKELIEQKESVLSFINSLDENDVIYFHRLMPTGRCRFEDLPSQLQVEEFAKMIQSDSRRNVRFHHTINDENCKAYNERLFIDCDGSIYGCGWVGNNKPIGNIKRESISSVMREKDQNCQYLCPLFR